MLYMDFFADLGYEQIPTTQYYIYRVQQRQAHSKPNPDRGGHPVLYIYRGCNNSKQPNPDRGVSLSTIPIEGATTASTDERR